MRSFSGEHQLDFFPRIFHVNVVHCIKLYAGHPEVVVILNDPYDPVSTLKVIYIKVDVTTLKMARTPVKLQKENPVR